MCGKQQILPQNIKEKERSEPEIPTGEQNMNDNEMLGKAIILATTKHMNQKRRDGSPYINHPLAVWHMTKYAGFGIKYQIVALLHDTLEDTDITEDEIREFGDDVLEAVKLLTKNKDCDPAAYVDNILQNHMAAVVKNFDIIYNMWDAAHLEDTTWARKYAQKSSEWYEYKFSAAADIALSWPEARTFWVNFTDYLKPFPEIDETAKLYIDKEKEVYLELQEDYKNRTFPDLNLDEMKYYTFYETYICMYGPSFYEKVWVLDRSGWRSMDHNPMWDEPDTVSDGYGRATREKVLDFIEQKKKEGFFYDFVDISKL